MENKKYILCIDPNLGLTVNYEKLPINDINKLVPIIARFNRIFRRKQAIKHKTNFYNNYPH